MWFYPEAHSNSPKVPSLRVVPLSHPISQVDALSTNALKASIPFSFNVQEAAMPAGDYTITF